MKKRYIIQHTSQKSDAKKILAFGIFSPLNARISHFPCLTFLMIEHLVQGGFFFFDETMNPGSILLYQQYLYMQFPFRCINDHV